MFTRNHTDADANDADDADNANGTQKNASHDADSLAGRWPKFSQWQSIKF